jgi:hypothetical protein
MEAGRAASNAALHTQYPSVMILIALIMLLLF